MPQGLILKWKEDDFTAEDLVFSAGGRAKRKIVGEDEANQIIISSGSLRTVFSSLYTWSPNDYTPKEASPTTVCAFFMRLAAGATPPKEPFFVYAGTTGENDYCYEEPVEINIELEDTEKYEIPIFQDIYNLYKECSEENWDGYGAEPISIGAYLEAVKLAELLPSSSPVPEVVPEPNGEIAFEWYRGKRFVFVVSVGGNNVINYAGLFGSSTRAYGSEYFGDKLPSSVIGNIQRLFS